MALRTTENDPRFRIGDHRFPTRRLDLTPAAGRAMTSLNIEEYLRGLTRRLAAAQPGVRFEYHVVVNAGRYFSAPRIFSDEVANFHLAETAGLYDELDWSIGAEDQAAFPVTSATVLIARAPLAAGGADAQNDCLYKAIVRAFVGRCPKMYIHWMSSPAQFKESLGVARADLVPVSAFARLDGLLGVDTRVTCCGDSTYVSPKTTAKLSIDVSLRQGHYTLRAQTGRAQSEYLWGRDDAAKPFLLFDTRARTAHTEDGRVIAAGDADLAAWTRCRGPASPWVVAYFDGQRTTAAARLAELLADCDALGGALDYRRLGANPRRAALEVWRATSSTVPMSSEIGEEEAAFVAGALRYPGIIAARPGPGVGHRLDVVSMYPSCMAGGQMMPIGAIGPDGLAHVTPTFSRLDALPAAPALGIYRARISVGPNTREGATAIFRNLAAEYWPSPDLYTARDLGLVVELIQDDQANAMVYDTAREAKPAKYLFGAFVDRLFAMKSAGCTPAKKILNCLWGALAQPATVRRYAAEPGAAPTELDSSDVCDWTFYGETLTARVRDRAAPSRYRHPAARCMPFVAARGRANIGKMLAPHCDKVRRIHTDGFWLDTAGAPLPADLAAQLGDGHGKLRHEKGTAQAGVPFTVVSANKVSSPRAEV